MSSSTGRSPSPSSTRPTRSSSTKRASRSSSRAARRRPARTSAAWPAVVRGLERGRDYETDAENANVFPTDAGIRTDRVRFSAAATSFAAENETLLAAVHCALHARRPSRAGRRLHRPRRPHRDRRRVHRPGHGQAPLARRPPGRRRSQGGRAPRLRGTHPRLDHPPAFLPALSDALRHDGHGRVLGARAQGILRAWASSSSRPTGRACAGTLPDVVFTHKEAKRRRASSGRSPASTPSGRPVLVGTASVRESEELAAALAGAGVACEVLNAKNDELEAAVIARAGAPGAVTISTNMAGRGTDIKLGGPNEEERDRVAGPGRPLCHRHQPAREPAHRQTSSAAGPAGRAIPARPGSSSASRTTSSSATAWRASLFARYRLERQDGAVDDDLLRKEIVHGQRVIEGRNLDIRRALWDYSTLVETQRGIVAGWRDAVFGPAGREAARFRPHARASRGRDGAAGTGGVRPHRPPGRALPHRRRLVRPPGLAGRSPRGHPPRLDRAEGAAPGVPEGRDRGFPRARGRDRRRGRGVASIPSSPARGRSTSRRTA